MNVVDFCAASALSARFEDLIRIFSFVNLRPKPSELYQKGIVAFQGIEITTVNVYCQNIEHLRAQILLQPLQLVPFLGIHESICKQFLHFKPISILFKYALTK